MLAELSIRDLAVIEASRIDFGHGLNVLTGETGSGKSMVVDAITLLLGGRAYADCVRSGSASCLVEGTFLWPCERSAGEGLRSLLAEAGCEGDERELIVSREITAGGRSIARVNGRTVPVGLLQNAGRLLADIHGQSEHLTLLKMSRQLEYLDAFAGLSGMRAELGSLVDSVEAIRRRIAHLSADEREMARRLDLLQFQVNEIEAARLVEGEEALLEAERTRLQNADKLTAAANAAYEALAGDVAPSAIGLVLESSGRLGGMARLDDGVSASARLLEEVSYQLDEVAGFLREYQERLEADPQRLADVEERLQLIARLKKKYGGSVGEIEAFRSAASSELEAVSLTDEQVTALRAELAQRSGKALELARQLSAARLGTASVLSELVVKELAELGMAEARFEVDVRPTPVETGADDLPRVGRHGIDDVEFLLAPNPGEDMKPLARIASGGELSRVLLALKSVFAGLDSVSTLVFDEIDSGIGGQMGLVVGAKLAALARSHQVLCVTHLPQIAAFADCHWRVDKEVSRGRTRTAVTLLTGEERVAHLAAMLGGQRKPGAVTNAEELLAFAGRR